MGSRDLERGGAKSRVANGTTTANYSYTVREDLEEQWTSWLIPVFVVINIAVFVVVMFVNDCPKHVFETGGGFDAKCVARFLGRFSFEPLSENPLFGPSSAALEKMGALDWSKVVHDHQGWRLLTCMWLHAGLIHILVNMLSLVFIGIRLEQQFGFVRIGIIYLLSGFGGSILSALFIQNSISVGASGALFGLLGAMLSELITNWTIYTNKVAALVTLLLVVLVNLAVGILPHVDNFAHIGGFLTGFFLGFILLPRPHFGWLMSRGDLSTSVGVRSRYKAYQIALWLISLCVVIAGFTVGLVMLFRGENGYEHCHWCRYLTCVPTSKWKCND
ncbi:tubulin folding cofactor A [Dionaea muscipula]